MKNKLKNICGLYLITDQKTVGNRSLATIVNSVISGGVSIIQYREKNLSFKEMLTQACKLQKISQKAKITFIINDNIELALKIKADGIHVGQKDLNAIETRKKIGKKMIMGVSVSTVDQAIKAQEDGADYLGVGPIFPTSTKIDADPPIGLNNLKRIREATHIPIIAIGGINRKNANQVMQFADGVAVISAVMGGKNPLEATRELSMIIKSVKR